MRADDVEGDISGEEKDSPRIGESPRSPGSRPGSLKSLRLGLESFRRRGSHQDGQDGADNTPVEPPPVVAKGCDALPLTAQSADSPGMSSLALLAAGGIPSSVVAPTWDRPYR